MLVSSMGYLYLYFLHICRNATLLMDMHFIGMLVLYVQFLFRL